MPARLFLARLAGAAALTAALGSALPAVAADAPDKEQTERIVRDYLLAHPEILSEMQAALDAKTQAAQAAAAADVIKQAGPEIFAAPADGVVGNPKATKTVVEFFDYNCGYCRHSLADMEALTAADPDLRFVLKEFPILGPDSQKAHVVSMAFRALMPDKYAAFHEALLGGPGHATEAAALKIALGLGADETKLRQAMKDPAIAASVEQTYDLANRLQISGTPSYVVGDQMLYGALGADALSAKIQDASKACGGPTNC